MLVLENSPRLGNLIHDGKLELSLADAVALTLENNLDIVVSRYTIPFSQTDVLRTKSGQAARGFTGALNPGELSARAVGAGVSSSGSTGGTGSAGGITGGGGAVSVGATGAFDPRSVSGSATITSPVPFTHWRLRVSRPPPVRCSASLLVRAGIHHRARVNSVSFSGLRLGTTQQNTLFNP